MHGLTHVETLMSRKSGRGARIVRASAIISTGSLMSGTVITLQDTLYLSLLSGQARACDRGHGCGNSLSSFKSEPEDAARRCIEFIRPLQVHLSGKSDDYYLVDAFHQFWPN